MLTAFYRSLTCNYAHSRKSFDSEGQPGPPTASAGALELARLIVPIEVKILGLYWGYMGLMEKKMKTTILGYLGLRG